MIYKSWFFFFLEELLSLFKQKCTSSHQFKTPSHSPHRFYSTRRMVLCPQDRGDGPRLFASALRLHKDVVEILVRHRVSCFLLRRWEAFIIISCNKVQSCSDHWGKDDSVILLIVASSLLGYSWLFLSSLPFLSNHSWGYPDAVVNTSFIPVPPKVQLYHYNEHTMGKRDLRKQDMVVSGSEVICRLYTVTLRTIHMRIHFPLQPKNTQTTVHNTWMASPLRTSERGFFIGSLAGKRKLQIILVRQKSLRRTSQVE